MTDVRTALGNILFALGIFVAYLFFLFLASSSLFALFSPSIPLWSGVLLIVVSLAGIIAVYSLSASFS